MKLPAIPLDKQAHALGGAVIVQSMILASQSMTRALIACALLALAKEIYDSRHPNTHTKDAWDFLATCAGGGVAALFVLVSSSGLLTTISKF